MIPTYYKYQKLKPYINKGKKWVSDIGNTRRHPDFFADIHFSVTHFHWFGYRLIFNSHFPIPKSDFHI